MPLQGEVIIITDSLPQTPGTAPPADQTDSTDPPHSSSNQGEGSGTSCKYCGKNLLDPAIKECSDCKCIQRRGDGLNTLAKGTEKVVENQHGKAKEETKSGPPCVYCGELLLTPTANTCNDCGRRQREQILDQLVEKAKADCLQRKTLSSVSKPSNQQPMFGPGAPMHPMVPGNQGQQQPTVPATYTAAGGGSEGSEDPAVEEVVTLGDALRRKRSVSKPEGEGVKQPRVDNEASNAAPKNGQREEAAHSSSDPASKPDKEKPSKATAKNEKVHTGLKKPLPIMTDSCHCTICIACVYVLV